MKRAFLCATALTAVPAGPAFAQQTSSAPTASTRSETAPSSAQDNVSSADPASQDASTSGAAPSSTQDIIVTGSRAVRNGSAAPTPVTVVTASNLANAQPASIAEGLKTLPQFQNSSGDRRRQAVAGPSQSGNFLNLRGLGFNRNLILMDGRRVPATNNDGSVDTNVVPELLVERVDVVTGGASAAYGSDAVSGVVNYIIQNRFVGVKGVAQGGLSTEGDATSMRFGLAYGYASKDDRLHAVFSGEYTKQNPIKSLSDRKYGDDNYLFTGGGTAANPWRITRNTRYSGATFGGLPVSGPFAGQQFVAGGVLAPYDVGTRTGLAGVSQGGQGGQYIPQWLIGEVEIVKGYGHVSYDVNPALTLWAQGNFAYTRNFNGAGATDFRLGNLTIYNGNAYLSPAEQALLGATPSFALGRINGDFGPVGYSTSNNLYDVAGGASGEVTSKIKWDVSATHGRSVLDVGAQNVANTERFFAALDAVRDPAGNIVCRVSLTNPGVHPGCVPVNLFGSGSPSAQALSYFLGSVQQRVANETTGAEASLHGETFDNWAGPIGFAIGVDWRHVKLDQTSSIDPSVSPNFTGIRGIPGGSSYFWTGNLGRAQGSQTVKEAFAELNIPLLKDMRFTRSLDLDLAGRITHYSTSGQVETWKVGVNWAPVDDLRFRFTRSRDIRAPSLIELYAGQAPLGTTFVDPHTGVQSFLTGVTQGSTNLDPERGDTLTGGVVYKPSFVRGLSLSVDYYNIKLNGAIIQPTVPQILTNCENSGGTSPDCALVTRPLPFADRSPANLATSVALPYVNAAAYRVRGIDFELNYGTQLSVIASRLPGSVNVRMVGSYLLSRKEQVTATSPVFELAGQSGAIDNGGAGLNPISYPKLRITFGEEFQLGGLGISLTERLVGAMKQSLTQVVAEGQNRVAPILYTDLSVRYAIPNTGIEPFVSVVNLTNTQPPLIPFNRAVPGAFYPTNPLLYDTIGRYFTVGVRFKF